LMGNRPDGLIQKEEEEEEEDESNLFHSDN
jgi:hypothetical protein